MNLERLPILLLIPSLATIGWYDLKYQRVSNMATYPGALLAVVLNLFVMEMPLMQLVSAALMAFVFGLILSRLAGAKAGDVKMIILIGVIFGNPWFLAALAGGFMLGGMITLVLIIARRQNREVAPLAFYLAISSIVVLLWQIY